MYKCGKPPYALPSSGEPTWPCGQVQVSLRRRLKVSLSSNWSLNFDRNYFTRVHINRSKLEETQNRWCILLGGKWGVGEVWHHAQTAAPLGPHPSNKFNFSPSLHQHIHPFLWLCTQVQSNCSSSQLQTMNCEKDDCTTDTSCFHQILVTSHKLCCHLRLALEQLGWVGVGSENHLSCTEVFSKSQNMVSCYYY